MTLASVRGRPGLSLLEVLAALAILLMAIVAVSSLLINAGQNAEQVHFQEEAVQIAQTKLAEMVAGALPLTAQPESPLDEDPAWYYAVECEQDSVANLWRVTVRVSRNGSNGASSEYCTLSQLVLDPAQRGSTQDALTLAASLSTSTEPTSSNPQQGTTNQGGTQPTTGGTQSTTGGTTSQPSSTGSTPTGSTGGSRSSGGASIPSSGSSGAPSVGGSPAGGSPAGGSGRPGGRRN
jgi:general secretion pathway protein I